MLRIINMFYNLDHCNKHAHHLLLYEIKDLLLLYISSRRRCISFSHVLYWFSLRLQIALKSQQSKQTYRQNIDSQKSNHCQLSLLYYLKCLAVSWPHPLHYSAVSISLVLSWSFTDAGGAADLCVCVCVLTVGGAEQHTERRKAQSGHGEACAEGRFLQEFWLCIFLNLEWNKCEKNQHQQCND